MGVDARLRADERKKAGGQPWITLLMVSSADGAVEVEGVSAGLGGPADFERFKACRALPDVIVVGAGTVRAENYGIPVLSPERRAWRASHGRPEVPRLVVVSGSLRLDPDARLFLEDAPEPPLLLTTDSGAATAPALLRTRAEIVSLGSDVQASGIVAELVRRSVGHAVLEGGPMLNAQFLAEDLIDEVLLTVSPQLVGGAGRRIVDATSAALPPHPARPLRLDRVVHGDGLLLLRYARATSEHT